MDKREIQVNVLLSKPEHEILKEICKEKDVKKAFWIRRIIKPILVKYEKERKNS